MTETAVIDVPVLGGTYQHFIDYLRDPDTLAPVLSPKRFSEALNIDLQMLAEQAHVHRNTISRAPGSRGVQDFLREALRIIKAATDLTGDLNRALFWYRTEPLAVFGYKTAERLASEGRTDDVLRYVSSLEAGAAGLFSPIWTPSQPIACTRRCGRPLPRAELARRHMAGGPIDPASRLFTWRSRRTRPYGSTNKSPR